MILKWKTNTTEVMNKKKNSYIILLFQRLASESENSAIQHIFNKNLPQKLRSFTV